MNIAEQIKSLVELQKLDSQIYKHNMRKGRIPLLIKELEDGFQKKGEALKEEDSNLKSLLVRQKEKENDLASKEETIKKCEGQLYQIKTNKEYTAMQQEIKGYGADKSVLEDDILALLDETEAKKRIIEQHKAALKDEEKKLGEEKEKVNAELKEIEEKLNSLNAQRSEMTSKIDRGMLSKYERVLKGKDGLAMVPVVEDSCGGCNLNLPPQVINEIKMEKDLVFCESCARILYIEE
ncbi:MAG: hypothetical protein ISS34_01240 [Candidatus Omnitrophica bacterium]|nr:hypothetical protein [Candidatus Omnitrophota bacterium]